MLCPIVIEILQYQFQVHKLIVDDHSQARHERHLFL
jgi:hypothetical protein